MMDVRPPQQAIEKRAELIVATDGILADAFDGDHGLRPLGNKASVDTAFIVTCSAEAAKRCPLDFPKEFT